MNVWSIQAKPIKHLAKKVLHLSLSLALHIGCIYMTIHQQFCKPWPISYDDWKGS